MIIIFPRNVIVCSSGKYFELLKTLIQWQNYIMSLLDNRKFCRFLSNKVKIQYLSDWGVLGQLFLTSVELQSNPSAFHYMEIYMDKI